MNASDLPVTGLVQPASRVNYRLAVAAPNGIDDAAVNSWVEWAQAQVKSGAVRGLRIESLANNRP